MCEAHDSLVILPGSSVFSPLSEADRKYSAVAHQLQGYTVAVPNKGHGRHSYLKTYLLEYLQDHQMFPGKQVI